MATVSNSKITGKHLRAESKKPLFEDDNDSDESSVLEDSEDPTSSEDEVDEDQTSSEEEADSDQRELDEGDVIEDDLAQGDGEDKQDDEDQVQKQ